METDKSTVRPFMREDEPPEPGEIEELRHGSLGRYGDALRALGDPAAVDILVRAVEQSESPAPRAVNRLRLAIALQYFSRHLEALEQFDVAETELEQHSPSHRHFLHQHRGKCLVEMGRVTEGRASLERALEARENIGDAKLAASTRRALVALDMRRHEQGLRRRSIEWREGASRWLEQTTDATAREILASWSRVLQPGHRLPTRREIDFFTDAMKSSVPTAAVSAIAEWTTAVAAIATRRELQEELASGRTFRGLVYWWDGMKELADRYGHHPLEATLCAGERAFAEFHRGGELWRVNTTSWFAVERDSSIASTEVESRACEALGEALDDFREASQFWRVDGPTLRPD